MPFRARVPYHGLVDWPRQRIDQYAAALYDQHQPRRTWLRRRKLCATCADLWPCTAHIWAKVQFNYGQSGGQR